MKGALRLGLVVAIWTATAFIANFLVPESWQTFTGYVGGIITGITLMVD